MNARTYWVIGIIVVLVLMVGFGGPTPAVLGVGLLIVGVFVLLAYGGRLLEWIRTQASPVARAFGSPSPGTPAPDSSADRSLTHDERVAWNEIMKGNTPWTSPDEHVIADEDGDETA